MVSFEQIRIVLERENIFALSVYPAELQVGPKANKSDQHSIWDELSALDRARPPKGGQACASTSSIQVKFFWHRRNHPSKVVSSGSGDSR